MSPESTRLLLRLLGSPVDPDLGVGGGTFALGGIPPALGLALFLAGAAIAVWTYRRHPGLSPARRWTLTALRTLLLASLVGLLLRPLLLVVVERYVRGEVALLIDTSASMGLVDGRATPADLVRAVIALDQADPTAGLDQSVPAASAAGARSLPRWEVARGMLTSPRVDLLPRIATRARISRFTFDAEASETPLPPDTATSSREAGRAVFDGLAFDGTRTAVGDAVRTVLDARRGQGLTAILLITDGAGNAGAPLLEAADLARTDGVPVHVYGVGVTDPRDLAVTMLDAPEVAFLGDAVAVTVRIRALNAAGRTSRVILRLAGQVVAQAEFTPGLAPETTVELSFVPAAKGDLELEASVPALPDEAEQGNNSATRRVRVIDRKLRVLVVEQQPRWEHRFLLALLQRDRRLEPAVLLLEPDPGLGSEPGSIYLPSWPDREALLRYDAVILGDVALDAIPSQVQQAWLDLVGRFGGGFVFLAGPGNPGFAATGSLLDPLLPVDFPDGAIAPPPPASAPEPVTVSLTTAGRQSPVTALADAGQDNNVLWAGFQGLSWIAPVARARPAAEVLVRTSRPQAGAVEGAPVLALQSFGLGTVAFIGSDRLWSWRRGAGEKYHTRLWAQLILRTAARRTEDAGGLVQLGTARREFAPGETIAISGRVFAPGFVPVADPSADGTLEFRPTSAPRAGGAVPAVQPRPLSLAAVPDRPGFFRAEFTAGEPGDYTFALARDPAAKVEFRVREPRIELLDPALRADALAELAAATGGRLFREEDLHAFPDSVRLRTEPAASPQRIDLASRPGVFLLVFLVALAEWILRRTWRLK